MEKMESRSPSMESHSWENQSAHTSFLRNPQMSWVKFENALALLFPCLYNTVRVP